MTGALFLQVGDKPGAARARPQQALQLEIEGGPTPLIAYHIVTAGRCFASLAGGQPIAVTAGQIVVFPRGERHVISSEPDVCNARRDQPPAATADTLSRPQFVCGLLAREPRTFDPLVENLPPMLVVDCSASGGLSSLTALIRLTVEEASEDRAGRGAVLGRLTELLFIEVVRKHVQGLPKERMNWLSGLRDSFVGRALMLMHNAPGQNWSLDRLAREIGLSRSEFAERFTAFVGLPPMQYLARWRMEVATALLRDQVNIASIAEVVGYGSEAAFSRAFKKIVGVPPSQWRREGPLAA